MNGPGNRRFFGLNVEQAKDYTIRSDADDKLKSIGEYKISRMRRKEFSSLRNAFEKSHFASIISSLGWIGTASLQFCSFNASHLQQHTADNKISDLDNQINIVRKLKRAGTTVSHPRLIDKSENTLTVPAFTDAGKASEYERVGVLIGTPFIMLFPRFFTSPKRQL